jgi:nucleoside-diphosphate-sugar epimerase
MRRDIVGEMTVDASTGSAATIGTPRGGGAVTAAVTGVWLESLASGLGARLSRQVAGLADLRPAAARDCDVAVLQPSADGPIDSQRRSQPTTAVTAALANLHTARHVVLVSSAMVYGAWGNNPIPLTEEAVLRPDVEFGYACELAAAEELVDKWRLQQPGRTTTILRPALAMAADGSSGLARALAAGMGQRRGEDDPPAQFLHLDDLTEAVLVAVRGRLDGVFNVAPDGWISGERVRALAGAVPRIKFPDRVNEVIANLRWRFQRGPIPPGLRSYTRWPWLVANDRLKSHGWTPKVTNEQAYVEGTEAKWWTLVSPKRRQEISLGGLAVVVLLVGAVTTVLVRRARASRALWLVSGESWLTGRVGPPG